MRRILLHGGRRTQKDKKYEYCEQRLQTPKYVVFVPIARAEEMPPLVRGACGLQNQRP
jgi:hypothetical protein